MSEDVVDAASRQGGNDESTEFWGYVDVRLGAHMFYWLYHSHHADGYLKRPLIIWLQVLISLWIRVLVPKTKTLRQNVRFVWKQL